MRRRAWALALLVSGTIVDALFGVETARPETLASLGLFAPGCCDYEPAPWTTIASALRAPEIGDGSVLLDVGSGKGRIVLAAAARPFARIVGVERTPRFHAIAEANLAAYRGRRRCSDIELVCSDATTYGVPDDVTHVFLNNPVIGDLAEAVFAQLAASQQRRPRTIRVVYLHAEGDALRRTFPDARRVRSRLPRPGLAVYDV